MILRRMLLPKNKVKFDYLQKTLNILYTPFDVEQFFDSFEGQLARQLSENFH